MSPLHAISGLLACAALAGCASTTPALDRDFGMAMRTVRMVQTLHPEAGATAPAAAAVGLDGRAAASAYENYQKSFATPEKASNALVIGIGK